MYFLNTVAESPYVLCYVINKQVEIRCLNHLKTGVNLIFICVFSSYSTVNIQGIIAVCSDIHTKLINTLCGQNIELLNIKVGGIYSNHWATKC